MFEQCVNKLGLLGIPLAGNVAYLYEQIRAFRTGFAVVMEHGSAMPSKELAGRLQFLLNMVTENRSRSERTIQDLGAFASVQFRPWFTRHWRSR